MHPYDDVNVIAGQGTIALELHEQVLGLDAVVVPVSGGGMSSGIALATKEVNPSCKVILTTPEVLEGIFRYLKYSSSQDVLSFMLNNSEML